MLHNFCLPTLRCTVTPQTIVPPALSCVGWFAARCLTCLYRPLRLNCRGTCFAVTGTCYFCIVLLLTAHTRWLVPCAIHALTIPVHCYAFVPDLQTVPAAVKRRCRFLFDALCQHLVHTITAVAPTWTGAVRPAASRCNAAFGLVALPCAVITGCRFFFFAFAVLLVSFAAWLFRLPGYTCMNGLLVIKHTWFVVALRVLAGS